MKPNPSLLYYFVRFFDDSTNRFTFMWACVMTAIGFAWHQSLWMLAPLAVYGMNFLTYALNKGILTEWVELADRHENSDGFYRAYRDGALVCGNTCPRAGFWNVSVLEEMGFYPVKSGFTHLAWKSFEFFLVLGGVTWEFNLTIKSHPDIKKALDRTNKSDLHAIIGFCQSLDGSLDYVQFKNSIETGLREKYSWLEVNSVEVSRSWSGEPVGSRTIPLAPLPRPIVRTTGLDLVPAGGGSGNGGVGDGPPEPPSNEPFRPFI